MKLTPFLVAAGTLLLSAPAAFGQATDTEPATATVKIIKGITLTKTADLAFGDIITGTTAGTVVMTHAGVRSTTGGPTVASGGTTNAAAFDVTGANGRTYAITLPSTAISLTGPSSGITVSTFVSSVGATGTLSGSGTGSFTVGATLNVGANQTEGDYTGTFDVTVNYN